MHRFAAGQFMLVAFATLLLSIATGAAEAQRRLPQSAAEVQLSFASVVRQVTPAVVNVYVTTITQQPASPFANDPFFEQFFGRQSPLFGTRPRESNSLGSGVIVRDDGIILTNAHVVNDATDIRISLSDGREFDVDLVLADKATDLAVLKIRNPGNEAFPTLQFGDSDSLEVGDLVLAVGNPFGVGQTVTSGIISGLARTGVDTSDFGFFIQTDAAINPGNSGGALVDMQGRLIGINTALFTQSGGSVGIGFAIPANMAKVIADAGESGNGLVRPWFGAQMQDVTREIAQSVGLDRPRGAILTEITPDSPAAKAGLKSADVITSLDGVQIAGAKAFEFRYATHKVGDSVQLDFMRDGHKQSAKLVLAPEPAKPLTRRATISGDTRFAGATGVVMTPEFAHKLGYREDAKGILVVEIADGSPAAKLGLQVNDVILRLNGQDIIDLETFASVASSKPRNWQITIQRGNRVIRQFING